ncbi:MAG: AMP-binding protein [Ignavibacteria bacterium]|nr:AMP-binding protein [Ignavibacteria bacterium]
MPHHYSLWQKRLRERLFERAYPLWVDSEGVLPAASLWYQMRERLQLLRDAEIDAGDRIVLQLPVHRDYLAWMFAALWQGCTVALAPPASDAQALAIFFSAKAVINENGLRKYDSEESIATPDICLLLASSGTSGTPRWIALSERNIFSVIDSHMPILNLVDGHESSYSAARVLSLLPLHHAFGLVIDFFAAFFAGAEIVRDNSGGRDIQQILRLAENHGITHCSFVPLLVKRLVALAEGQAFLRSLQGGVIGGAPVNSDLARFLRTTRLRVGYGQTEASPGITLGEPGVWQEHYLGQTIGCETRMNTDGVLEFCGENAHIGLWTEQGLVRYTAERWVNTGDYVKASTDTTAKGYIFVGRADDTFKLANGRFIPVPEWEMMLRSRLEGCTEVMIFSHDGERCTVYLAFSSGVPMQTIEQLRKSVLKYLPIPNDLLDEVRIIPLDKWLYTPKGSTNRSAMREYASSDKSSPINQL